ncbi:ABC transporter permease [Sinorhizobium meliloti]|nr:ABC transporter permease [Sinorhizobium meliloti]UFX07163.1 ABC transporter permease [Sinorhizobium meliloti]
MDMRAEKNPDIPAGGAGARKTKLKAVVFQAGPLIALVLLMAYLAFATSNFLTLDNLSNVARQSAFVAILAVGQTFVILTGGIDLSVAAIAALSASITAVLLTQPLVLFGIDFGFVPPPVAILIGILIGMAAGALNGWLISKFKIPDFIATLGTMTAFRGAALLVTDGLPVPSFNAGRQLPESLIWVGGGQLFGVPVSALIALLCAAAEH